MSAPNLTNETRPSIPPFIFPSYLPSLYVLIKNVPWCVMSNLCQSLADLGEDRLVFDVVFVVCLEFSGDTVQSALQGIFGRGVHHLGL
jgi:hypothetical protein